MAIELAQQEAEQRIASPWQPTKNTLDLKHLGKLSEELAELSQVVARCIIQGVDEVHPVTGKSNKLWLAEEVADVYANLYLLEEHFSLDTEFVYRRSGEKLEFLESWHGMK